MNSKRSVAQLLKHLTRAGVTHLPKVDVVKPSRLGARLKSSVVVAESSVEPAASIGESTIETPAGKVRKAATPPVREMKRPPAGRMTVEDLQIATDRPPHIPEVLEIMGKTFSTLESRQDALCVLAKHVAGCRRCPDLASKRTQTVFGVGNPAAEVMFIGEAPGAEEDAKGEPFVGPAGQLLDKIIDASQLKRQNLYICNILRCRPPGNRNPLPQEVSNCREFLDAQIHVVQPKYIVCWGTVAAQNLLNRTEAVGKLRGQLFDYQGIKVMCTYHPSYLLRNPAAKKQVWEDMKFFMRHLGVELQ